MLRISFLLAALAIVAYGGVPPRPKGDPCPDGDGFYSIGCSNHYLQCVHGQEFTRDCPAGLYFNRILSRCERRQNVYSCEHRHRNEHMIRQKAFEVDCVNRKDGIYSFGKNICVDKFYMCSNGIGAVRVCPDDQYYIARSKRCESLEVCESSKGSVKDSAAEGHAAVDFIPEKESITTVEVDPTENGIDCATLGDATISKIVCGPYFWQCANGKLFRKTCPKGLMYDAEKNYCEYPEGVSGCKDFKGISEDFTTTNMDQAVQQPAPMEDSIGAPAPAPEPTTPTYSMDEEKKESFECHDKEDGFFGMGSCLKKFASCIDGHLRIIECNDGLVYDARINSCDYPDACKSDRKHETVPPLFNHGGVIEKKNQKKVKVQYNCTMKSDGLYAPTPCDTQYIQCLRETALIQKCPGDLVFNLATKTCDFRDNCDKNYVAPSTTTEAYTTTSAPSTTEYTTSEATTTTPAYDETTTTSVYEEASTTTTTANYDQVPSTTPSVDFSCSNVEDGNHASGQCKSVFYICSNKIATASKCPATLVFNPYNGQCDYTSNVPDCREMDQGVVAPPTYTTTTQAAPVEQYQPEPYCERLSDGTYGFQCESFYYNCKDLKTQKIHCQHGKVYNLQISKCDAPENVEGCGATTTTTPSFEIPTTVAPPTVAPPTTAAPSSSLLSCTNRVDGIYALPYCSRHYVQCVAGRSLTESCVKGLFYSEKTGLCDYKENVHVCNEEKKAEDAITSDSCAGKKDGYYAIGCSSVYHSCIGGKVRKMECPQGLKFGNGKCDYPQAVQGCVRFDPIVSPPSVENSFCNGKPNGLFEREKCSSHYVVCDNGIATSGTCATPLVFNDSNQLCDWKSNNVHCSDATPTSQPPY